MPRVLIPFPTWDDFLRLALDEIRVCGANSIQVTRRMMALIKSLIVALPPERHAALQHWQDLIQNTIGRTFEDDEEKREAAIADRQGLGMGNENGQQPLPRRRTMARETGRANGGTW